MKLKKSIIPIAAVSVLVAMPAFADDGTWNSTTTPAAWNLDTNWTGSTIADGTGNTADFSQVDITADTTVNLTVNRTIGNLIFGDTTTGTAGSWILSGGGGALTLAGATPTITVNALGTDKRTTINAAIAGTSGFTKNGAGTLILDNTGNTLSGAITLSAGLLQLNSASLTTATSVAINAGTLVLATGSANALGGSISFGGGTLQYNTAPGTDYSAQFSTAANQAYKIIPIGGVSVTFASNLSSSGGALVKNGNGDLTLSAANTFDGTTTVSLGNLILSNALALQNSTIDTTNSITGNATQGIILSGVTIPTFGGLSGTKALSTLFNTSTGGYGSVTGLTLNPGTGISNTYSGVIADGATGMTLTKTGAGTQILSVANTYTGGTHIHAGKLSIGNAAALGSTGAISFGGGTLQYNGISTDLSSRFSTADSQAYNVDTNGQNVTWATALSSSGSSLTKSGTGNLTLAVASTGGLSTIITGPINVNAGRLSIVDGYSHINSTGAITVASGAAFNFGQKFITGNNLTNALTLSGAGDGTYGAFNLGANAVATGGITLNADATITHDYNFGTIQTGVITGSGRNLQLTTTVAGQGGLTINSAIQTGTGGISVTGVANSGAYSVRLGGNNTFTGGLTINNGVVQLNSTGALNSTAGSENAVIFGAGTTTGKLALNGRSYVISNLTSNATPGSPVLENGNATAVVLTVGNTQNLSGTFAGVIQDGTGGGSLSVTKTGTGTLILSSANTYTGATTVHGGTLALGASGSLASTSIVVGDAGSSGAVLDVSAVSGGFKVASGQKLSGIGTVTGATTIQDGGILAAGNSAGTETFSAGLAFSSGSIFEWDMQQGSASDPGAAPAAGGTNAGSYDKVVMAGSSGSLTGSGGIFQIVLGAGESFADAFWDSNKTWNDIFTGSGVATANLADIFTTFKADGANLTDGVVTGQGSFTLNGTSTLNWTAVPEPTSALAGLLVTAGLLRRRRR